MITHSLILSGGNVLLGDRFEQCTLKIHRGVIRQIASSIQPAKSDTVVDLNGATVLPGLINAHDHLEFNLFSRIGSPPYSNYIDWGDDIHSHNKDYIQEILRVPLRLRLLWGAYKNILSGVTTVVHHNAYYHHFRVGFPVDVLRNYSWIHSMALDRRLDEKLKKPDGNPCIIHISEGSDELSSSELLKLQERGGLRGNTVLIHGVALSDRDIDAIARAGASLVWCPSSNMFLFNRTAPFEQAMDKIKIALGTDSTLTGSRGLLDEIRFARNLKQVDPGRLLAMVTSIPAAMFGMAKGAVAVGLPADLLVFHQDATDPLEGFLNLDASAITCLLRKGIPILGDPETVRLFRTSLRSYVDISISETPKMIRGNFHGLANRISKYLPSFDFNGLPIKLASPR